jgi:hypothetical protein
MTDDELRALVRDAIARHLGSGATGGGAAGQDPVGDAGTRRDPPWRAHSSFGRLLVSAGDEEGGPCLIEPAVHCNHCGFCQSYGH